MTTPHMIQAALIVIGVAMLISIALLDVGSVSKVVVATLTVAVLGTAIAAAGSITTCDAGSSSCRTGSKGTVIQSGVAVSVTQHPSRSGHAV